MKALLLPILLMPSMLFATMGPLAKPAKKERVIKIEGAIRAPEILSKANALYEMSAESDADIKIIINSPGGAVFGGLQFINAMEAAKARGVNLRCYVPGMAASLAFQFLLHCSERNAMQYSLLLFHPVRIQYIGIITPQGSSDITKSLKYVEDILLRKLRAELKLSDDVFNFHYIQETMHTAEGLNVISPGFVNIVNDIPGMKKLWPVDKMRNRTKSNLNRLIYDIPCPNKRTENCGVKPNIPVRQPRKVPPKKKDKEKEEGPKPATDCTKCHQPHKNNHIQEWIK